MIACTHCSGTGHDVDRPRNFDGCPHCGGLGAEPCFDCRHEATRTSLTERTMYLCSSCAVVDDIALAEYLATLGVTGQRATAWMLALPLMSDAESKRLAGLSDLDYLAAIEAAVGRRAA